MNDSRTKAAGTADAGTTIAPSLRNLQILEVLARAARPMTPTEINGVIGLPKPTIHRLVAALEAEGYLCRHIDGRSYLPGARLRQMMLGVMQATSHDLPRREVLRALNAQVGETCNLSVMDGDAMVYVDRVETHWPLRIALQVGSRVPLHATSAGKLALSFLPPALFARYLATASLPAHTAQTLTTREALTTEITRIRAQGYAQDDGEFVDGMIALAVPVLVPDSGALAATVSFHAPRQRLSRDRSLDHLGDLRRAADALAALL